MNAPRTVLARRSEPVAGPVAGSTHRGARRRANRSGQLLTALAFLAPALLAIVFLRLVPAASAVVASFQESGLGGGSGWAGLENYRFLFSDPSFVNTIVVTVVFNLVLNPLTVILALGVALLLSERLPAAGLWRALVFAPVAVPVSVSGVIWSVVYQPDGLANGLLGMVGLGEQPFLTSTTQAPPAVMVTVLWVAVGYWMIFLIAGLKDIPRVYYEAAQIDGASPLQQFRHVTIPLLRRPMAFVLVANTVGNFLIFAPIQILTNGGPEGSTNLIMFDIYQLAYRLGDLSLAQTEVVLLMLVMLAVVAVQFKLLAPKE
ncbi:carbohydrate ABC transporter membrane protein 1 (CUT1 family) [Haloactinopolyspora alba]|uniref:Carbohydrate ABC transporter membrane protein 1 (CUT1 family) n=1 Tax=Haloactinopolyspora alba TaxID=648780 RepID=A0A2P8E8P9_9ACTN|nr:sugar ABC transporter permease [Haloactinopolyspora alba]PSL05856.1 carbohydrate ABC transporter membrane protein 1 (CUT1 family) [Haloactinopolyspora alba]